MSKANLKLLLTFEFEIVAPETLIGDDRAALCREFDKILGALVFEGMPMITGKQLAKANSRIVGHCHRLEVENLSAPEIDRALMMAAAPHLIDGELDKLSRLTGARAGAPRDELKRILRRQALALVNEYRLVPCEIMGQLKFGGEITVGATLNLTNGSVMIDENDRRNQLKQGTGAVTLVAADGAVRIPGNCAGHTLSGPVIDVAIDDIAVARDELIRLWQAGRR
jgi:hypothetical protein